MGAASLTVLGFFFSCPLFGRLGEQRLCVECLLPLLPNKVGMLPPQFLDLAAPSKE
jgi:hypothetical protein